MSEEYSRDKHVIGKCLHCGAEFSYVLKANFLKSHPNITMCAQLYCSQQCESASSQEFAKLQKEREAQNTKPREKFCPKCGYVPKIMRQKHRKDCPKCATIYSWREVKQDVIERIE